MTAARDNSSLEAEDDEVSNPIQYASDETSSEDSHTAAGAHARIDAEEDEIAQTGDTGVGGRYSAIHVQDKCEEKSEIPHKAHQRLHDSLPD